MTQYYNQIIQLQLQKQALLKRIESLNAAGEIELVQKRQEVQNCRDALERRVWYLEWVEKGNRLGAVTETKVVLGIKEREHEAAIQRFTESLYKLRKECDYIDCQIVVLRDGVCTIDRLPPELLLEVFGQFVDSGGSPFTLRYVCTQWRRIMDGHGEFWKRILVTAKLPDTISSRQVCVNITQLHNALKRTRKAKLDIIVQFYPGNIMRTMSAHSLQGIPNRFKTIDEQHQALVLLTSPGVVERLQSFSYNPPPANNLSRGSHLSLPAKLNLASLSLKSCSRAPIIAQGLLENVQTVCSLEVENIVDISYLQKLDFWKGIRRLEVKGVPKVAKLIDLCENLETLVLRAGVKCKIAPSISSLNLDALHIHGFTMATLLTIHMPRLTKLRITSIDDKDRPETIIPLNLPRLHSFDISVSSSWHLSCLSLPTKLDHLTINTLELGKGKFQAAVLSDIFHFNAELPSTRSLTVISGSSPTAFNSIFQHSAQLQQITLILHTEIKRYFWDSLTREVVRSCANLQSLVIVYDNDKINNEGPLRDEVHGWANRLANLYESAHHPLDLLMCTWPDGTSHVVRGAIPDLLVRHQSDWSVPIRHAIKNIPDLHDSLLEPVCWDHIGKSNS